MVKKLTHSSLLIEIPPPQKKQGKEIFKWKHFDNIKIKTYLHNTLNSHKGVVKSPELSLCTLEKDQSLPQKSKCDRCTKNLN